MKKNIQAVIPKFLSKIKNNIEKMYQSSTFSKKKLQTGLFEWSNEKEKFFSIKQEKKKTFQKSSFFRGSI